MIDLSIFEMIELSSNPRKLARRVVHHQETRFPRTTRCGLDCDRLTVHTLGHSWPCQKTLCWWCGPCDIRPSTPTTIPVFTKGTLSEGTMMMNLPGVHRKILVLHFVYISVEEGFQIEWQGGLVISHSWRPGIRWHGIWYNLVYYDVIDIYISKVGTPNRWYNRLCQTCRPGIFFYVY